MVRGKYHTAAHFERKHIVLVLTRKRFESIQIGENIVIKIIHTGHKTVKLGIEAPADIRVMRAELCEEPLPRAAAQTLTTLVAQRRGRLELSSTDSLTLAAK